MRIHVVLLLLLVLVAVGCSDSSADVQEAIGTGTNTGNLSIEDARAFDAFRLYWPGPEFDGLALEAIIRNSTPGAGYPDEYVVFIYGTCETSLDAGCSPPLQVRIEPGCVIPPPVALEGEAFVVGGARAQRADGALYVWQVGATVKITGQDDDMNRAAGEALVALNQVGVSDTGQTPSGVADCFN